MKIQFTKELGQFNRAAIAVTILYLTLQDHKPQHMQLEEFQVLQDWLCGEDKEVMYGMQEGLWYPEIDAPDICATCYTRYKETRSGRVRRGCHACTDDRAACLSNIHMLKNELYVNDTHMEYIMARALAMWTMARTRIPLLTQVLEPEPYVENVTDVSNLVIEEK